jgi:hypothetical protein
VSGGRPRKAPAPTHCELCGRKLPAQLGAGRPRRKCLHCAPPSKATSQTRARRSRPVLVESAPDATHADVGSFDVRGQALWNEWIDKMPSPGAETLLREACRLADRAERMHQLIVGQRDAFAVLAIDDVLEEILGVAGEFGVPEVHVNLNMSSVTIEARNTATALRSIVAELRTAVKQASGAEQDGAEDPIAAIAKSMADRMPTNVVRIHR